MKKTSTVATKASRNISRQKLTIGLDLGDRNSWYCVLEEAGQIQLEQRVRTTSKALQEVFGALPRSRVALETGTHSPWKRQVANQMAAPAEPRTPNLHRATRSLLESANGSMATAAIGRAQGTSVSNNMKPEFP